MKKLKTGTLTFTPQKKPKSDAFIRELRARIKQLRKFYDDAHSRSFIDEDSDSYDEAQRIGGALHEAIAILVRYVKFKEEQKLKNPPVRSKRANSTGKR